MTAADESQQSSSDTAQSDGAKPSKEELQADIEQTREQLGETVEALTAKLDVKSRTRERVNATKQQAADKVGAARANATAQVNKVKASATDSQGKPTTPVLAGTGVASAVVVGLIVLLVWRRRR